MTSKVTTIGEDLMASGGVVGNRESVKASSPVEEVDVYARISNDHEGLGLGVKRQVEICRSEAASRGWRIRRVHVDNDISAYSGKLRPAYEELLSGMESGMVRAVLTWHPDRLHRSPQELERYIDISERFGVVTHTVQAGHWDLSSPDGRMRARLLGAVARYESEHKSARIRAKKRQAASQGKYMGGPRPFGYESDGVTIRASEAEELRRAAEAVISGVSLRYIVRDLTARGVPTSTGKTVWYPRAIQFALTNPRIAGLSAHHGEVVGQAGWPAILSMPQWEAVRAILTNPARQNRSPGGPVPRWLGSGIYRCGVDGCNSVLHIGSPPKGDQSKKPYWCRGKYMMGSSHVSRIAASLDHYVERSLVEKLSEPGLVSHLVQQAESPGVDVKGLIAEQSRLREQERELGGAFADGKVSVGMLAAASEKIQQRLQDIAREVGHAGGKSPFALLLGVPDVSLAWFGSEADRSDGLPLGVRRAMLDSAVTVTVLPIPRGARGLNRGFKPDFVRLEWKFDQ